MKSDFLYFFQKTLIFVIFSLYYAVSLHLMSYSTFVTAHEGRCKHARSVPCRPARICLHLLMQNIVSLN